MIYRLLSTNELSKSLQDMRLHQVAKHANLSYPVVQKMLDGNESITKTSRRKISKYFLDRFVDLSIEGSDADFWAE